MHPHLFALLDSIAQFKGDFKDSKAFSESLDLSLGYRKHEVEKALAASPPSSEEQAWIGLPLSSLETPYPELFEVAQALKQTISESPPDYLRKDFHMIDLGAGYGRAAIVFSALFPDCMFTGYEILKERVTEGNRILSKFGISQAMLVCQNLADLHSAPEGDVFFIYDLGHVHRIRAVLSILQRLAMTRRIVVVGRGRATRTLIETEQPWLSQVHPARHFINFSIYFS